MRILLTNDDGFHAQGLQALATALRLRGDTVWIVAPKANKSGTSCCITLDRPVAVTAYSDTDYALDGTPADCVHVALTGLASAAQFDVVLSGMNDGANLGDDAIHSGTLGAATQARLFDLPALACSLVERGWAHLDTAVECALTVLDALYAESMAQKIPLLWNLNIPNLSVVPSVVPAFVGRRTASHPVQALLSPKGEPLFWLGHGGEGVPQTGNDIAVVAAGHASLSPITLDRTDHAALADMRRSFN
jgi:5'-nucleotidase